jgi:hypothetical protein
MRPRAQRTSVDPERPWTNTQTPHLKARGGKPLGGSNPSASAALTSGFGGDHGIRVPADRPGCSNGVAVAGQAAPQSILSTASRMLSRLVCA